MLMSVLAVIGRYMPRRALGAVIVADGGPGIAPFVTATIANIVIAELMHGQTSKPENRQGWDRSAAWWPPILLSGNPSGGSSFIGVS